MDTEIFLRKILEAKEEKSSIRSKSSILKTEHDKYARGLIHVFKEENIECLQVSPKTLGLDDKKDKIYIKVSDRNPRQTKTNAKQVNNFSKQWIESNETCIVELRRSFDYYLSNPIKAMEELEKTFNATRNKKIKEEEEED
jgi:hypothetical protein